MNHNTESIDLEKILEGYMKKHTAIIYGRKERKIYRSCRRDTFTNYGGRVFHHQPEEDREFIELVKIGEYEISHPPFTRYDRIFLHEIDVSTTVDIIQRSTADKWIYQVKHVVELIDDEESLRSYEKALAEIEQHYDEPEPRGKPRGYSFDDSSDEQEKRWWQFWK